jgi:hypothetical protein
MVAVSDNGSREPRNNSRAMLILSRSRTDYLHRIHARARCVTLAVAALAIVACGERGPAGDSPANAQPSGPAAAPAAPAGSPVGAWERFIPNREAPIAYEVLEFFDTGWLILHNAQGV